MKKCPVSVRLLCLGVGAIAVNGSPPVLAQSRVVLDEIIVTAQKREENLQEVPLSISAVSAEQLELRNIEGLDDLNGVAPNG